MDNKQIIASELAKVIDSLDQDAILNLLEQPKSSDLGDIAFPAFSLAKVERKAPQAIAADIVEKIDTTHFDKVVATGPYVNFFLNKAEISGQVIKEVVKEGADYGQQNEGKGENVTIDLSSPNIAKPFSVGHLRSTVIGDALSNIFRKMATIPSKSTTWVTGVNNSVSSWSLIKNGEARKLSKQILSTNCYNSMSVSMPKSKTTLPWMTKDAFGLKS